MSADTDVEVVARAPQSVIDRAIQVLDYWSDQRCNSEEQRKDLTYAVGVLRNLNAASRAAMSADPRVKVLDEALEAAKKHLQSELNEPGRTVFWKIVDALSRSRGGA